MSKLVDLSEMRHGTELLKRGFAKMQEGGVIMDVVTPEQAHIAEDAGATAVMALERVPADIRADGGVARMSHPDLIRGIIETTSIPVLAKARIGHDEEARVLQTLGVDMVDESEVLTPADPFYHIAKNDFTIPFVCGCTNLGEACRRIMEGAAMIRTKGEAGTGNVVSAIQHARLVAEEISLLQSANDAEFEVIARTMSDGFRRIELKSEHDITVQSTPFGSMDACHDQIVEIMGEVKEMSRLPVVTFSAGGIATPSDAALLMKQGMDGVFVGSGIFKSESPATTASAIVMATHHFNDPEKVTEASSMMAGKPMDGLEIDKLEVRMEERGW